MKTPADDDLRVSIDETRLEAEWRAHPEKLQKIGDLLADATDRVDRLKSMLEVVKARIELRVRKQPGAFGLDKATEGSVTAVVTGNEEVVAATDKLHKARHRAALLKSLYEARRDCRPALENLVKLFLAGYFGDPKAPAGAGPGDASRIQHRDLYRPLKKKKKGKPRGEQA